MFVVTGGRLEDSEAALERVLEVQVNLTPLSFSTVQEYSSRGPGISSPVWLAEVPVLLAGAELQGAGHVSRGPGGPRLQVTVSM